MSRSRLVSTLGLFVLLAVAVAVMALLNPAAPQTAASDVKALVTAIPLPGMEGQAMPAVSVYAEPTEIVYSPVSPSDVTPMP